MDNFDLKKYLGNNPLTKENLNEGITWENRKSGERLPTMEDYKEAYNKKQVKEGPIEDFEDEEFEAHSATLAAEPISHWDDQGLPQMLLDDEVAYNGVKNALNSLLNLELDGETINYIVNVLGYEASGNQIVGR